MEITQDCGPDVIMNIMSFSDLFSYIKWHTLRLFSYIKWHALRIYVPIVTLLSHLDIPSGCPNQMSPNFYTLHVCFYIPDVLCLQFLYFSHTTALDIMTFSKTLFTWNLTLTYACARDSKCLPDQHQSKATKTFWFKVQLELV